MKKKLPRANGMKWNTLGIYKIESNIYLLIFLCGAHKDIECFAFFCTFSLDVIVNWSIQSLKEKLKKEIEKIDSPLHPSNWIVFVLEFRTPLQNPPHRKIHPHKQPLCNFRRFLFCSHHFLLLHLALTLFPTFSLSSPKRP